MTTARKRVTPATRASSRIAKKTIRNLSTWYPKRTQTAIAKYLARNEIVPAMRIMYNLNTGNVSSRIGINPVHYPKIPKYNASRNRILSTRPTSNRRTVERAFNRSFSNKSFVNIVDPITRGNASKRGGVNPAYIQNAYKNASTKYATVGTNRKLKAFALIKNKPNSRYINVIGAFPGYGHSLMNKIINNAKKNGLKRINLKAVTHVTANKNANNDPLVKWYAGKGFVRAGPLNNGQLLPMSINL